MRGIGEKLASRPGNKKLLSFWSICGSICALILIIVSTLVVINVNSSYPNGPTPVLPTVPSVQTPAPPNATSSALQASLFPAQTALLKSYCHDLLTQNYAHAYTLLAPDAKVEEQDHMTLDQFLALEHNHDELLGAVTGCDLSRDVFADEATLTITRRSDTPVTLPSYIHYQQRGQDWKITLID